MSASIVELFSKPKLLNYHGGGGGGGSGGKVVSLVNLYSHDLTSNPAEVFNFCINITSKRTETTFFKRLGIAN